MAAAQSLPQPMAALLLEAQKSLAHHAKTVKALLEIEKKEAKTFGAHFIAAVDRALIVPGREPAVERFIKFVVLYACTHGFNGRGLLERLLRHLVTCSKAEDKNVRHRSCQIISGLMCKLAENNAQLDAALTDHVKDALLLRTKDKSAAVRSEAATGLSIFQDARVADEVFDQYVRLLDDPQKEVRSAALGNISLSKMTLTEVMKRTRDADDSIRQETYKILAQKIPFQKLSVEQRVDVLRSGLSDSTERVRTACMEMIKGSWLPACKGDIPTLLGFLDVEDYEECAEILLRTLLQDVSGIEPFGNKKTVTAQEALFWRMFAEQIKTRPAESRIDLEELLPGMETMKTLLSSNRRNEFICRQLLLTCAHFDPGADELGCRELCSFLETWVYSVQLSEDMRVTTCRALAALHDADSYKRFMLTAIRDFSSESIDTIMETSAASSSAGWAQCITLVEEWFTSSKELPAPLVQDVVRGILLPLIPLHDASVRNRGMKCLGLACTLSEHAAKQFGEVLLQAIQNDIASVRQTAMKAIFDLIMVWGTKIVSQCSTDPLSYLATCLSPTTPDALRRIAVEGFVKLLVSDTVRDEKILAQLFVLHFELRDERASVMKRCLQTFFEAYSRWSHRNQSIITKAYVSTIHSILRAAPSSSLKKVKPLEVTQFIAALTNPTLVEKKKQSPMKITSYHNQLALAIASEVHTSQRVPEVEEMLKALPTLHLNKQDTAPLVALASIVKSLQTRSLAEPVKKALVKVVATMKELGVELPAEAAPEPTNPRPVDKKKRTLNLARVVPEEDQDHLASLEAFDLEEEKPAKRSALALGQKLCGSCQSALAAWRCHQCVAFWCNTCLQSDHKSPVFLKHTVTAYSSSPQRSGATPKKVTIVENNSPELVVSKSLLATPTPSPAPPSKARPSAALPTPEPKKARVEVEKTPVAAPSVRTPVSTTKSAPPSVAKSAPPRPSAKPAAAPPTKRAHSDVFALDLSEDDEPAHQDPVPSPPPLSPAPASPPVPVQSSGKRARSTPAPAAAAAPTTSDTAPQAVKVAFSGFSNQALMGELCKQVTDLGGLARLNEASVRLSLKATHVIVENVSFRTLKTVIAAVCGMWIVTPQWVRDSAAAGHFVHEGNYGKLYCTKPNVEGKRFFLSAGFRRDPRFNSADWHTLLVRVGEGRVVEDAASADFVLVANGERVPGVQASAMLLTWAAVMEMLQPSA